MDLRIEGKNDGPTNMSRDVELLASAERGMGGARVYFWDSVWVTLGRNQLAADAMVDLSVPHIVRPTGGAAVLHGHDLTIGIALPLSSLGCSSREVKKAYVGLVTPIISAFNAVGVPAVLALDLRAVVTTGVASDLGTKTVAAVPGVFDTLATVCDPPDRAVESPYCFGMKSDYDVLNRETGEKVCGCAMKVTRLAALVQASIPICSPLVDGDRVLRDYQATPVSQFDMDDFVGHLGRLIEGTDRLLPRHSG